jgi:HEAT repeat protein
VKKASIVFFLMVFFGCVAASVAQESVEQYLLNLSEPKEEDYVKLVYEGSRENKLLALGKLMELGSRSEETREAYIFGLEQGTVFVKREAGKVTNDFWDVRAMSAKALGELGDPQTLPNLHNTLRYDPDLYVRTAVAVSIGKIGDKNSIREISRVIETSRPGGSEEELVLACVVALGEIGDKEGFVPLVEVLRGKYNRNIKLAARESLKKLRW